MKKNRRLEAVHKLLKKGIPRKEAIKTVLEGKKRRDSNESENTTT
jgi:uncharacterized protein YoaH (UPF0181 family)